MKSGLGESQRRSRTLRGSGRRPGTGLRRAPGACRVSWARVAAPRCRRRSRTGRRFSRRGPRPARKLSQRAKHRQPRCGRRPPRGAARELLVLAIWSARYEPPEQSAGFPRGGSAGSPALTAASGGERRIALRCWRSHSRALRRGSQWVLVWAHLGLWGPGAARFRGAGRRTKVRQQRLSRAGRILQVCPARPVRLPVSADVPAPARTRYQPRPNDM